MSDEQSFEDIINNQPAGEDSELKNIWEALEHLWPTFYPGHIPTGKGIIIAEFINEQGLRDLRFVASPDTMPWDMQGMLRSASVDADNFSQAAMFYPDEEDEEE